MSVDERALDLTAAHKIDVRVCELMTIVDDDIL